MSAHEVAQNLVNVPEQVSEEDSWQRFRIAAATGGMVLALAACTAPGAENTSAEASVPAVTVTAEPTAKPAPESTESTPDLPTPTLSARAKQKDACRTIKRGKPDVECVAPEKGLYMLIGSKAKIYDTQMANEGDTFQLKRKPGVYTMECYDASVQYYALPKDGTGKAIKVDTFNICEPHNIPLPKNECPEIDPGFGIDPRPDSEIDPGFEIPPRDDCPLISLH